MIKLYSTGCPVCKAVKKLLDDKGIEYDIVTDKEEILSVANRLDIIDAPFIIKEDGKVMTELEDIYSWVKGE